MGDPCGYEYDSDDDEPFEARCELDRGHGGDHRCTHVLEWATKPIDVCREKGHLWGEWRPYERPARADISEILIWSMMPVGGHLETVKAPTKERTCGRCDSYETDGESRWAGMSPMPLFAGQDLGTAVDGTKLTWAEDRLSE